MPNPYEELVKEFDEDEDFKLLFHGKDKALYWSKNKLKSFLLSSHLSRLQRLIEEVEKIDVCGGGSGRRIKIQLLSLLTAEREQIKKLL